MDEKKKKSRKKTQKKEGSKVPKLRCSRENCKKKVAPGSKYCGGPRGHSCQVPGCDQSKSWRLPVCQNHISRSKEKAPKPWLLVTTSGGIPVFVNKKSMVAVFDLNIRENAKAADLWVSLVGKAGGKQLFYVYPQPMNIPNGWFSVLHVYPGKPPAVDLKYQSSEDGTVQSASPLEEISTEESLPGVWKEEYDDDGDPYYFNIDLCFASYDDPRIVDHPVRSEVLDVAFEQPAQGSDKGKGQKWTIGPCKTALYKKIPKRLLQLSAVPPEVRNRNYNRHLDILPNPATIVALPLVEGRVESGYVNANFVRGYDGEPAVFIAAMGPLAANVVPFWRMIWKNLVNTVIMVTGIVEKGVKKCERYFPSKVGGTLQFGSFNIQVKQKTDHGHYVHSVIRITRAGQIRDIDHWWFTSWPDHGVPVRDNQFYCDDVIDMLMKVNATRLKKQKGGCCSSPLPESPMLVHCSAGVGRTGTFISLQHAMERLQRLGSCDILDIIESIRQDRCLLVQHPLQYEWLCAATVRYAEKMNHPYEVPSFSDVYGLTNAAPDAKSAKGRAKEKAAAQKRMKQAKKRAKKQNQSVQRRKSSLTTNLPGLEMDGVIYTFYEGTDDAKMDWDTAKEQGMPKKLFDAIDEGGQGFIEAAVWAEFLSTNGTPNAENTVVTVELQNGENEVTQAQSDRWFVGDMDVQACEAMVLGAKRGGFVVRGNASDERYIVVINDDSVLIQLTIDIETEETEDGTKTQYVFNDATFSTMKEAIKFIRSTDIPSKKNSEDKISLGQPIEGATEFQE
eukprot:m.81726 g.81726  ORF g.81726 m.81726 type:complete len:787 (-) comp12823_c0_seq3:2505-4865(-)